jgi:hypothetical protein
MKHPIAVLLVLSGMVTASVRAQPPPVPPPEQPSNTVVNPGIDFVSPSQRPQLMDPSIWGGAGRPPLNPDPTIPVLPGPDWTEPYRFYGGAEYLMWWIRAQRLPPLITTSSVADRGILGRPTTTILWGNQGVSRETFSGVRYTIGYWFGEEPTTAFEVTGFVLGQQSDSFSANSTAFPVIARPFFNVNTQQEFSEIVASPGRSTGSIAYTSFSRVWGMEADGRCRLPSLGLCNFDLLGGFRFLDLEEGLTIVESVNALPGQLRPQATNGVAIDNFHTRNQFYGGQLGGRMEFRYYGLFLDLQSKVAFGSMTQTVGILGAQQITPAGLPSTPFLGGLLAEPSNIGTHVRNRFCVVPEANMNVGYQVASFCRLYIGYSFLCASSVVRPADQIDRSLNVAQIPNFDFPNPPPGPLRPLPTMATTAFWAQGINFSTEFRY